MAHPEQRSSDSGIKPWGQVSSVQSRGATVVETHLPSLRTFSSPSKDKGNSRGGRCGRQVALAPTGRERETVRLPVPWNRPNLNTRTDNEARWSNCDYDLSSTEYRRPSENFGVHGV